MNLNYKKTNKINNNIVEQVFLIYEDGRLLSYVSIKDDEEFDEDIVSGMLTTIMNALNIIIISRYEDHTQNSVFRLKFGEKRLIIENGNSFYIAIILLGEEDQYFQSNVDAIIKDIEHRFKSNLDGWNGDMDVFKEVDDIILTLLPLDKLSETERMAIIDYKAKNKIFALWSRNYHSIIQNGILPKPQIWKNFNWKLDLETKNVCEKERDEK